MYKLSVFVGSVAKDGTPVAWYKRERCIDLLSYALSQRFGGCTRYDGKGRWISDSTGVLVSESVSVLVSICDEKWEGDTDKGINDITDGKWKGDIDKGISASIEICRQGLSQETILVTVEPVLATVWYSGTRE